MTKLKEIRNILGITQKEAAILSGYSARHVARLDRLELSEDQLKLFAKAFRDLVPVTIEKDSAYTYLSFRRELGITKREMAICLNWLYQKYSRAELSLRLMKVSEVEYARKMTTPERLRNARLLEVDKARETKKQLLHRLEMEKADARADAVDAAWLARQ